MFAFVLYSSFLLLVKIRPGSWNKRECTLYSEDQRWTPSLPWNKVFFIRVNLYNLELLNLATNIPVVLQSSTIKMWDKSFKGFMRTERHKNKQRLKLHIYIDKLYRRCPRPPAPSQSLPTPSPRAWLCWPRSIRNLKFLFKTQVFICLSVSIYLSKGAEHSIEPD